MPKKRTYEGPAQLIDGYKLLLEGIGELGYPVHDDENFADTIPRAAKALTELVRPKAEIDAKVQELLESTFASSHDQLVLSKHNVAFGLCPHHLLPVIYRVSLAYIPNDRVIGISKLSRLAKLLARRPDLQEELTGDLAEFLHDRMASQGAGVYVEGLHLCMAARGVQVHEARLVTSCVRGVFRTNPATRHEFFDLVQRAHPGLV